MSDLEPQAERVGTAASLMAHFAERTGLVSDSDQQVRYLWTDAFAVCNFLGLAQLDHEEAHRRSALRLVDDVHRTLGRHRPDDPRSGWISGLPEEEGTEHPTRGGLRIGKPRGERGSHEHFDEHLEWERDGQYFHYSTKWMHALSRVATATGEPRYLRWAIDLARATYAGFVRTAPDGSRRLAWKMSIDLSRPLVPSAGHHDPLDGLITFLELRSAAATRFAGSSLETLDDEIAALRGMTRGIDWATADPLGLGGLLADCERLLRLVVRGGSRDLDLLERLFDAALTSLAAPGQSDGPGGAAATRLAFRELGLAI
ncbi:MAG: hypothetical protein R3244_05305, partial [Thermoanaerobaculia bacterium]|nr:hypothetical protein [Thermoanaerobaculia bacterium]